MKQLPCCGLALILAAAASGQQATLLRVNGQRIGDHLRALSRFGANPQGGVSRVAYSEADLQGRAYAITLLKDAGLAVHIDEAGNIVGTRPGSDPALKPLLLGSHIDSVPMGGNYDGDVGSLSAIEVAQVLKEKQIALRHPLEVILFQDEEGGTIGSQALGEGLTNAQLDLISQSGKTIREGTRLLGGSPDRIAAARRQPGSIAGYFELHIEQGGREGFANHAGATPMDQRHDALLSAARFIEKVNQVVTSVPGTQVGTVGWVKVEPGAYNVIPGKVVLGLEVRDLSEEKFLGLFHRIQSEAEGLGKLNQMRFSFTEPVVVHPSLTGAGMRKVIDETARSLGFSTKSMPSGAGHDAQEIARVAPAGMVFIPSIDGISHSPKEFSRPQDIENGANVLLQSVISFDRR
jgi:beta-ureidopropionase / N-carbamoyl-L-amino-acid hydrolase